MGSPADSSTDRVSSDDPNTSEMHNSSVDHDAASEGVCAQLHLPTGRMCTLPHGHAGSCDFLPGEAADAARVRFKGDKDRQRTACAAPSKDGWDADQVGQFTIQRRAGIWYIGASEIAMQRIYGDGKWLDSWLKDRGHTTRRELDFGGSQALGQRFVQEFGPITGR
jgi:hypothetical protein